MAALPQVIAEALEIDSMKDSGLNAFNQPAVLCNYVFEGRTVRSRPPNRKVMDNSVSGNYAPVGGGDFVYQGEVYKVYAHPNGKIWVQKEDGATPVELVLSTGGNALHFDVKRVRVQQQYNKLFIVAFYDNALITTRKLLVYDGITDTVTDITTQMTSGATKQPIEIFQHAQGMQLGIGDINGEVNISKLNVDVATEPTPFDTSAGGISFVVTRGDGLTISNIATAGGQLIISKELKKHRKSSLHTFTGISNEEANFEVKAPFKGFYGDSAHEVGLDVLGLTSSGFDYFKTLANLGEATSNTQSRPRADYTGEIPDNLLNLIQEINKDKVDIITSVYNEHRNEVYFSVPIGQYSTYNNLVIVLNMTEGKYRFSIWNHMSPALWFKANGSVYFMDNRGEIWKTLQYESDDYEEETAYGKLLVLDLYDMRNLEDAQANSTPATWFINEFGLDIEVMKTDADLEDDTGKKLEDRNPKEIKMYYETLRQEETFANLVIETNRGLNETGDGERPETIKKIYQKAARQKTVADIGITDIDSFDARISKRSVKTLTVNKSNVVKIRMITLDNSTGLENVHTIHGYLVRGTPEQEK